MPIYEYACKTCTARFETLVLSSDEKVVCPSCHGSELEKLISAPSVGHSSPDVPPCEAPSCGAGACPACQ